MVKNRESYWLLFFFLLTFAISWLLWLSPFLNNNGTPIPGFLLAIGNLAILGPGIAAFIMRAATKGKTGVKALLKSAWHWKYKKLWLLAVVFIPIAVVALTAVLKFSIENEPFSFSDVGMPAPLFVIFLLFAGGPIEEFGWRGYALPLLLKKFPLVAASLILGVVHGIWHLPLHFMAGTVQSHIPVWEFVAVTAVGAIIYSWLFVKTNGSVTAMIIHHWVSNLASAFVRYWDTELGRWIFFGVQLAAAVIIIVIYNVKKDKRLLTNAQYLQ